ncbi:MAG: hypothetical protein RR420_05470 [Anaerovoracaceae bacterium]
MYYYRARDLTGKLVYGYPIIVPKLPFPSAPVTPPAKEAPKPPEPVMIAYMFSNDVETYRDDEEYEKVEIDKESIEYYIGEAGKNFVGLYEGDIITATIYPFEDFNALIIWNDSKKAYMMEYHKKSTYTGKGIFDGMQREIEYIQNANIDVIGNKTDNADLL